MKHLKRFLLCGLGLSLAACSLSGQGIKTEKFSFEKEAKHCTVKMSAELPVAANDDASTKITSQLYSILKSSLSDEALGITLSPYNGSAVDSRAMADYYFRQFFEKFNKSSDALVKEEGLEDYEQSDFSFSLEKGYETDRFVVFAVSGSIHFPGMPRPYSFQSNYTFSKKDGRFVDKFLDSVRDLSSLQPMIRKGLCEYFETDLTNLGERLQVDVNDIPLPSSALYPSEKGVVFHYAQNEIALLYEGEPSFTVPYDGITPFLTKDARELLIGECNASKSEAAPAQEEADSPVAQYLSLVEQDDNLFEEERRLEFDENKNTDALRAQQDNCNKQRERIQKQMAALVAKYKDYKLTASDRQALKNYKGIPDGLYLDIDPGKTFRDLADLLDYYRFP